MIAFIYRNLIARRHRPLIKKGYNRTAKFIADAFFPYTAEDLKAGLREIGVREGDSLFVHASFSVLRGFQGSPQEIIACLLEVLGDRGNLLMPSMPYMSSTHDYLAKQEVFRLDRTPSRMGLISELFRRRPGVVRSLSPAHPVLAFGKDAAWLAAGHEDCVCSCGRNTPFDKFCSLRGKVLFFDVPFNTFTFIHFLEDRVKDRIPFPLYRPEPVAARAIDREGRERVVMTSVFSEEAVRSRRPEVLGEQLGRSGAIRRTRIGRSTLMLVAADDAVHCMDEMVQHNTFIYRRAGNDE